MSRLLASPTDRSDEFAWICDICDQWNRSAEMKCRQSAVSIRETHMTTTNDSKPAIKCATMWGNLVAVMGAALPLISVELANFAPSRYVRLTALFVAIVGIVLSTWGRVVDTKKISGLW